MKIINNSDHLFGVEEQQTIRNAAANYGVTCVIAKRDHYPDENLFKFFETEEDGGRYIFSLDINSEEYPHGLIFNEF